MPFSMEIKRENTHYLSIQIQVPFHMFFQGGQPLSKCSKFSKHFEIDLKGGSGFLNYFKKFKNSLISLGGTGAQALLEISEMWPFC